MYVNCRLKQHEPAIFLTAMLNSQPLEEAGDTSLHTVRLGLRQVNGLALTSAERMVAARAQAPFTSTEDLALCANLDRRDLNALAGADA